MLLFKGATPTHLTHPQPCSGATRDPSSPEDEPIEQLSGSWGGTSGAVPTLEKKACLDLLLGLNTIYSSARGREWGGTGHSLLIWARSWQNLK